MRRRLLWLVVIGALVAIGFAVVLAPRTATATGVVVAVEATSLTNVTAFTIRDAGGVTHRFALGGLENAVEFPPGHLQEHIVSGVPVIVTFREEAGVATAIRLTDAPAAASTPAGMPGST